MLKLCKTKKPRKTKKWKEKYNLTVFSSEFAKKQNVITAVSEDFNLLGNAQGMYLLQIKIEFRSKLNSFVS